jgi:hypothetical protein
LCELFAAVIAVEWQLIFMDSHVVFQIAQLGEFERT